MASWTDHETAEPWDPGARAHPPDGAGEPLRGYAWTVIYEHPLGVGRFIVRADSEDGARLTGERALRPGETISRILLGEHP